MRKKLDIILPIIIFLALTQPAVAGPVQNGLNTYVSLFKNALLLIQFDDMSGKIIGNYRSEVLNGHGTSEKVDEKSFTGHEGDGTISITFQYGGNWIGKVRGRQIIFEIPNFVVGEPLSSVRFTQGTPEEYNEFQAHNNAVISHNIAFYKLKHISKETGTKISREETELSDMEKMKTFSPNMAKSKYVKQIDSAKSLIDRQIHIKEGERRFGEGARLDQLGADINGKAANINGVTADLGWVYDKNSAIEAKIKKEISELRKNCLIYMNLQPYFKKQKIVLICKDEHANFSDANAFYKKVKNSNSLINKYKIKYNNEIEKLEDESRSIEQ